MGLTDATFPFLSQEDVIAAGGLEIGPTVDTVEEALRLHARGETILPHKPTIRWSDDLDSEERDGRIMAMPAYVGGSFDVAGLKWIPSVPSTPLAGCLGGSGSSCSRPVRPACRWRSWTAPWSRR